MFVQLLVNSFTRQLKNSILTLDFSRSGGKSIPLPLTTYLLPLTPYLLPLTTYH